jgi:hypothetical protein
MPEDNGIDLSPGMVAKTNVSANPNDSTPLVSPTQINMGSVPEYERPIAQGVQLQQGSVPKAIAYSTANDIAHININHPDMYTAGVQAHELQHMVQKQAGMGATGVSNQNSISAKEASMYDYGGTEGLAAHLKSGKTVGDLTAEQQASIPQNYMDEYRKAVKAGDAKSLDRLNQVYQPAIQQLRNMANPSTTQINTTPAAPGPPPASMTGLASALPGMYSSSTSMAQLPIPRGMSR